MRKVLNQINLPERPVARAIIALALCASLAAFGCTTNRNPMSGQPYTGTPSVGPTAPTSHTSVGYSQSKTMPPPMTSSYQEPAALPAVTARPHRLHLSPDEAAAIVAGLQPNVKVLGPSAPGFSGRGYASAGVVTGVPFDSASYLSGQASVNPSLTSPGIPVVSSGAGGDVLTGTSVAGASAVTPQAAAVFNSPSTPLTTTNAAIPLTPGMFSAGGSAGATRTTTTTSSSATNTLAAATTLNPTTVSSGNVRLLKTNGKTVVTNQQ